eukprot:NODE_1618_length_792_cov_70.269173_g1569_i0.p1 GENE.NODE_1618_length_792_cov_70.269173_g1569_i0~~NODE_1618_length_792_cov_70.269173_g1569_i0.p1  ORF type:complete len:180 (+),score=22.35 NODE_1618_length_792_cov_70.269173_g1569_i0:237-776(+)
MWTALEDVYLMDKILENPAGLDAQVSESKKTWSTGQKQLFCFARALLSRSQILVVDQPSSSLDYESELLIQECIRDLCADKTVITISHRLSSIMDTDRILVLDSGYFVECDTPRALMNNEQSVLYQIVKATGPRSARILKLMALGVLDIFGDQIMKTEDLDPEVAVEVAALDPAESSLK